VVEVTSAILADFVCQSFGGQLEYTGPEFVLSRPVPLGALAANEFSFCSGARFTPPSDLVAVICGRDTVCEGDAKPLLLRVDNPRLVFGKAVANFFAPRFKESVHPTAVIESSAVLEAEVCVGAHTVIDDRCHIGARSRIGSNVVLGPGVRVGEDCVILSGSVIGEAGFGVEFDAEGHSFRLPHIGGVVLEDRVHVGSLCSIAAGTLAPTILREDVQLDNKVHVAHNVDVGARSLVTACAEISGSVVIGSDCWLGPNSSVMNKIKIGRNSLIGLGAVVTKDVGDSVVVAGSPARVLRSNPEPAW